MVMVRCAFVLIVTISIIYTINIYSCLLVYTPMKDTHYPYLRNRRRYREKKTPLPQALPDPTPFIRYNIFREPDPDEYIKQFTMTLIEAVDPIKFKERLSGVYEIQLFFWSVINPDGFYIEFKNRQRWGNVTEAVKGIVKELMELT